ncbi:MAG TPA: hypothetical protein VEI07_19360 [Planctomycetaceae bacterium]|nr:hypothetical protein [Planctomycetaceae bacterium]
MDSTMMCQTTMCLTATGLTVAGLSTTRSTWIRLRTSSGSTHSRRADWESLDLLELDLASETAAQIR